MKKKYEKPSRIVKRFLFFPKTLYTIDGGCSTRWLEFAEWSQSFYDGEWSDDGNYWFDD